MGGFRTLAVLAALGTLQGCSRQPAPGEGYVTVTGGKIWYRIVGTGRGTPLVVLHGGPGAPSYYLSSLGSLGNDRPVIFYDQLGAGRSDQPNDTTLWRMERFLAELDSVRARLQLREIHLLGHSWGTMLAADYVLANPKGVKSLILASPALSIPRWKQDADTLLATLPESIQTAIHRNEAAGTFSAPDYQAAVQAYYASFLSRHGGPDLDSTFAHFGGGVYGYMWGPSEFTPSGTLRDYDRTGRLGELHLPVLYTAGEFDEARPETVVAYQQLTPNSRFALIPASAHLTSIDAPEAFADTVRSFLAEVERRR